MTTKGLSVLWYDFPIQGDNPSSPFDPRPPRPSNVSRWRRVSDSSIEGTSEGGRSRVVPSILRPPNGSSVDKTICVFERNDSDSAVLRRLVGFAPEHIQDLPPLVKELLYQIANKFYSMNSDQHPPSYANATSPRPRPRHDQQLSRWGVGGSGEGGALVLHQHGPDSPADVRNRYRLPSHQPER